MQIYISGALISAKNRTEAHDFYEFLANICEELTHTAYLPHQNSDPELHNQLTNGEVFEKDLHQMLNSDIILASITEASTGVGAEIGLALKNNIPVIAVYEENSNPSRFILGLLRHYQSKIIQFNNWNDCKNQISEYFDKNENNLMQLQTKIRI